MKTKQELVCVLLVDDESINNYLHSIQIKKIDENLHVETKLNGRDALDYLLESYAVNDSGTLPKPGLILLDLNMPKMNGWEFLKEFSQLPEDQKKQTKVAVLTASINPDDRQRATSFKEVTDYLNKPLRAKTIRDLIETHFKVGCN